MILPIAERRLYADAVIDAVADALAQAGGDKPFRAPTQAVVVTARAGAR